MPFELEYESGGVTHPLSYWRIRFQGGNLDNLTGHFVLFGYHDVASFDDFGGVAEIGEKRYDINDPAIYELCFGQGAYDNPQALLNGDFDSPTFGSAPFFTALEGVARAIDDFFSTAEWLSSVEVSSIEIGVITSQLLSVTFSRDVALSPGGDFADGVTIKINGVSTVIIGAELDGTNVVEYLLTDPVDINDVVTWEYDSTTGTMIDGQDFKVRRFSPIAASNTLGTHWVFELVDNSAQWALIGE